MKKTIFTLRHFISFVALLSMVLSLVSSMYSGYHIEKQTLIQNTLETNRVYAQKLANTTDDFLKNALQTLGYSPQEIAAYVDHDETKLLKEISRLYNQMNFFNSVMIANADGEILVALPESLNLKNQVINPGGQQALREKKACISKPYTGITGRLLIFISTPIFNEKGDYLGLIGGSLYLKEENILNELLGEHQYQDGSYVYVVDSGGQIIYHIDNNRINDDESKNPVVQQLIEGKNGSQQVVNTKQQDMLAGYASIPTAGWGVVAQRPTEKVLGPAKEMVQEVFIKSLPFILFSIVVISFIAKKIARPLHLLAYYAEYSTFLDRNIDFSKIKTPYYEAIQLKRALVQSLAFFHDRVDHFKQESTTDPLTKLTNRRTLDEKLKYWITTQTPFSLIMIDIDRFKLVNDTYGHSVGDDVLQFLAGQMIQVARKEDVCCRYGGEEFIILLPLTTKLEAYKVAERLRTTIENIDSPTGKSITVSAGISSFPEDTLELARIIKIADQRLYKAKESGRNRTVFRDE